MSSNLSKKYFQDLIGIVNHNETYDNYCECPHECESDYISFDEYDAFTGWNTYFFGKKYHLFGLDLTSLFEEPIDKHRKFFRDNLLVSLFKWEIEKTKLKTSVLTMEKLCSYYHQNMIEKDFTLFYALLELCIMKNNRLLFSLCLRVMHVLGDGEPRGSLRDNGITKENIYALYHREPEEFYEYMKRNIRGRKYHDFFFSRKYFEDTTDGCVKMKGKDPSVDIRNTFKNSYYIFLLIEQFQSYCILEFMMKYLDDKEKYILFLFFESQKSLRSFLTNIRLVGTYIPKNNIFDDDNCHQKCCFDNIFQHVIICQTDLMIESLHIFNRKNIVEKNFIISLKKWITHNDLFSDLIDKIDFINHSENGTTPLSIIDFLIFDCHHVEHIEIFKWLLMSGKSCNNEFKIDWNQFVDGELRKQKKYHQNMLKNNPCLIDSEDHQLQFIRNRLRYQCKESVFYKWHQNMFKLRSQYNRASYLNIINFCNTRLKEFFTKKECDDRNIKLNINVTHLVEIIHWLTQENYTCIDTQMMVFIHVDFVLKIVDRTTELLEGFIENQMNMKCDSNENNIEEISLSIPEVNVCEERIIVCKHNERYTSGETHLMINKKFINALQQINEDENLSQQTKSYNVGEIKKEYIEMKSLLLYAMLDMIKGSCWYDNVLSEYHKKKEDYNIMLGQYVFSQGKYNFVHSSTNIINYFNKELKYFILYYYYEFGYIPQETNIAENLKKDVMEGFDKIVLCEKKQYNKK